jgi:hypothetical protein
MKCKAYKPQNVPSNSAANATLEYDATTRFLIGIVYFLAHRDATLMSEQEIAFTEDFHAVKKIAVDGINYLWFIHRRGNHLRVDLQYDIEEAQRLYIYLAKTSKCENLFRIGVIHLRGRIIEPIVCTLVRDSHDTRKLHQFNEFKLEDLLPVSPFLIQMGFNDNAKPCMVRVSHDITVKRQQQRQLEIYEEKYRLSKALVMTAISTGLCSCESH